MVAPDHDEIPSDLAEVRLKAVVQLRERHVGVGDARVPLDDAAKERAVYVVERRDAVKPLPNVVVPPKRLRPQRRVVLVARQVVGRRLVRQVERVRPPDRAVKVARVRAV